MSKSKEEQASPQQPPAPEPDDPHALAARLFAYDLDRPRNGPHATAIPHVTPGMVRVYLGQEHDGDCVKQPQMCMRCYAEEMTHFARYLAAYRPAAGAGDAVGFISSDEEPSHRRALLYPGVDVPPRAKLYLAPVQSAGEAWAGHRFKEVERGRWVCACGFAIDNRPTRAADETQALREIATHLKNHREVRINAMGDKISSMLPAAPTCPPAGEGS